MKKFFLLLLICVFALGFLYCYQHRQELEEPVPVNDEPVKETFVFSEQLPLAQPLCKGLNGSDTHGHSHEIISHTGYTLCYREEYEQAEWVCYELNRDKLNKAAKRQNNFRPDPAVSTDSSTPEDYRKSGYDRGHLAPAADMAYDEVSMSESFFMSNMSPQAPDFNRHIWAQLEKTVRDFAEFFGKVYIVTGPVLEKEIYPVIGENNVAVPEYYYKVLLAFHDEKWIMLAFILPNQGSDRSIWDYVVTVDEVEERTGIDFFYLLDENLQTELESKINTEFWKK